MATYSSMFTPRKFPLLKWGEDGTNLAVQGSNIGPPDHTNGHDGSFRHPLELFTSAADGTVGDQVDRIRHKRKRRRLPPPRGRPMRRVSEPDNSASVLMPSLIWFGMLWWLSYSGSRTYSVLCFLMQVKVMDSLEPVLLFTKPLDAEKVAAAGIIPQIEPPLENGLSAAPYRFHGRIGRGGRVIFDRWNPLSRTPIGSPSCPFTSPHFISQPRERFYSPTPSRLDIDATTHANLNSVPAAAVDHTSRIKAPVP